MSPPWMPLYIADYLADTAHLGALESGAYLHLIMQYWQNGGVLPDDDKQLARIAKLSAVQWRSLKPVLRSFFHDGWRHKRIDRELAKAAEVSASYAARASKAATKRWSRNASSIPKALPEDCLGMPISHSPKKDAADAAPIESLSEEQSYFSRGKAVLGRNAGGQLVRLLKAKNGNIALARAVIEQASTKHDPREYVARVINGAPQYSPQAAAEAAIL